MNRLKKFLDDGAVILRYLFAFRRFVLVCNLFAIISLACNFLTREADDPIIPTQTSEAQKLDEQTLNRLEINLGKSAQAKPGDTVQLQIGVTECCYVFKPIEIKTRWSVAPQTGAKIDPQTGLLEIAADAAPGAVFTITADVQDGLKTATAQVTIYTEQANPLVGIWHEVKQIECTSLAIKELEGDDILRELVFKADGTFQATFTPFEIYHDYWGTYTFDPQSGALEMAVLKGNYIPENLDLQGKYKVDEQGQLTLLQIWLGRREKATPAGCGHVFKK